MTTKASTALNLAREAWLGHKWGCNQCQLYVDGKPGTLRNLCWRGTRLFMTWQEEKHRPVKKARR